MRAGDVDAGGDLRVLGRVLRGWIRGRTGGRRTADGRPRMADGGQVEQGAGRVTNGRDGRRFLDELLADLGQPSSPSTVSPPVVSAAGLSGPPRTWVARASISAARERSSARSRWDPRDELKRSWNVVTVSWWWWVGVELSRGEAGEVLREFEVGHGAGVRVVRGEARPAISGDNCRGVQPAGVSPEGDSARGTAKTRVRGGRPSAGEGGLSLP